MQQLLYKRYFPAIALLFLSIGGCHTSKKTTGSPESPFFNSAHLSSRKVREAIRDHYIDYHTLSARVQIDYDNGKEQYNNITAYLRMKKDSAIWLSVRPVLGIEMARLVLTPDSVKLRNNLKKTVFIRSAENIEQVLHIPFNFSVMESLLIGNPAFIPDKIKNFKADTSTVFVTLFADSVICRYQWSRDPFLLEKSHFQMSGSPAFADQRFSAYRKFQTGLFSLNRNINMQTSATIRIRLSFDKIKFDVPVQFPFYYNENDKVR